MTGSSPQWAGAVRKAERLRNVFGVDGATTAVVCGSGLAGLAGALGGGASVDFKAIGLPTPKVAGHGGSVHLVDFGERRLLIFSGRTHLYEGVPVADVVAPIRVAAAFGCSELVVTNAAASTKEEWSPGSIVAISDHINLTGHNPLTGDGSIGSRFVDMTTAYDATWVCQALSGGAAGSGVYAAVKGPSYETPAEVKMLRHCGADLIGMSTVCEVIAARQLSLRVLGLSLVTNMAAGMAETLDHAEVVAVGGESVERFVSVVVNALKV